MADNPQIPTNQYYQAPQQVNGYVPTGASPIPPQPINDIYGLMGVVPGKGKLATRKKSAYELMMEGTDPYSGLIPDVAPLQTNLRAIDALDHDNGFESYGYSSILNNGDNEDRYAKNFRAANPDLFGGLDLNLWNDLKKIVYWGGGFLEKTLESAVIKTGQGLAGLYGLTIGNTLDAIGGDGFSSFDDWLSRSSDNIFSRVFDGWDENLKERYHYFQEKEDRDRKGFIQSLGDGDFWMNDISDGLGFLVSAAFEVGLVSKLGLGTKLASRIAPLAEGTTGLTEATRGANALTRALNFAGLEGSGAKIVANGVDLTAQTLATTAIESMSEAKEVRDKVYASFEGKINPETGYFYTEEEKKRLAAAAAGQVFKQNMTILIGPKFLETLVFNNIGKYAKGIFNKAAGEAEVATGKASSRVVANEGLSAGVTTKRLGYLNNAYKLSKYATLGFLSEGLFEENMQLAISREAEMTFGGGDEYYRPGTDAKTIDRLKSEDDLFGNVGRRYLTQTRRFFKGVGDDRYIDDELSKSIGIGGLFGITGGALNYSVTSRQQAKVDRYWNSLLNGATKNLFESDHFYMTEPAEVNDPKNPGKKIPGTKIVLDRQGNPVVDRNKVGAFLNQMSNIQGIMEIISNTEDMKDSQGKALTDKELNQLAKNVLFSKLAMEYIKAGKKDELLRNLASTSKLSDKDITALGYSPANMSEQEKANLLTKLTKIVERLEKRNDWVENNVLDNVSEERKGFAGLRYTKTQKQKRQKEFEAKKEYLRGLAMQHALLDSYLDEINESEARLGKPTTQILSTVTDPKTGQVTVDYEAPLAPISDAWNSRINALRKHIEVLEKEFGYHWDNMLSHERNSPKAKAFGAFSQTNNNKNLVYSQMKAEEALEKMNALQAEHDSLVGERDTWLKENKEFTLRQDPDTGDFFVLPTTPEATEIDQLNADKQRRINGVKKEEIAIQKKWLDDEWKLTAALKEEKTKQDREDTYFSRRMSLSKNAYNQYFQREAYNKNATLGQRKMKLWDNDESKRVTTKQYIANEEKLMKATRIEGKVRNILADINGQKLLAEIEALLEKNLPSEQFAPELQAIIDSYKGKAITLSQNDKSFIDDLIEQTNDEWMFVNEIFENMPEDERFNDTYYDIDENGQYVVKQQYDSIPALAQVSNELKTRLDDYKKIKNFLNSIPESLPGDWSNPNLVRKRIADVYTESADNIIDSYNKVSNGGQSEVAGDSFSTKQDLDKANEEINELTQLKVIFQGRPDILATPEFEGYIESLDARIEKLKDIAKIIKERLSSRLKENKNFLIDQVNDLVEALGLTFDGQVLDQGLHDVIEKVATPEVFSKLKVSLQDLAKLIAKEDKTAEDNKAIEDAYWTINGQIAAIHQVLKSNPGEINSKVSELVSELVTKLDATEVLKKSPALIQKEVTANIKDSVLGTLRFLFFSNGLFTEIGSPMPVDNFYDDNPASPVYKFREDMNLRKLARNLETDTLRNADNSPFTNEQILELVRIAQKIQGLQDLQNSVNSTHNLLEQIEKEKEVVQAKMKEAEEKKENKYENLIVPSIQQLNFIRAIGNFMRRNITLQKSNNIEAKKADIERRRQEELNNVGVKQKERAFSQLRDEKDEDGKVTKVRTPEEKLNAVNLIERNVAEGSILTKEEQEELQKTKDELASQGYEVPKILGQKYHEGMRVIVTNSIPDETLAEGEEVITKVLNPQINKDGKMVQTAQIEVTVGTKKGGLTREQWLEEQKKKETRTDKINAKYDAELAELEKINEAGTLSQSESFGFRNWIFIQAPGGAGKCLGKGTKVLMYDLTFKDVEDISKGDILMGDDGTPRIVQSLATGKDKMYKIIPKKGEPFICNEPHILTLISNSTIKKYGFEKNGIYDIPLVDYLKLPKWVKEDVLRLYRTYGFRDNVNSNIPLKIDPYYFGIWLGDGDSDSPSITNMDQEIIDYLFDFCKTNNHEIYFGDNSNCGKAKRIIIHDSYRRKNNLRTILNKEYNVLNNKHIPNIYLFTSEENRLKLLAGLIDTDGFYSNGYYEVFTTSEKLAQDISKLCHSLGFVCNYKKKPKVNGYRISITGNNLYKIPVLIPRKKCPVRKQIKDANRTSFSVEYIGLDNYYGFEIDGNKRFIITNSYFVTHNTQTLGTWFNTISGVPRDKVMATAFTEEAAKGIKRALLVGEDGPKDANEMAEYINKLIADKNYEQEVLIIDEFPAIDIDTQRALFQAVQEYSKAKFDAGKGTFKVVTLGDVNQLTFSKDGVVSPISSMNNAPYGFRNWGTDTANKYPNEHIAKLNVVPSLTINFRSNLFPITSFIENFKGSNKDNLNAEIKVSSTDPLLERPDTKGVVAVSKAEFPSKLVSYLKVSLGTNKTRALIVNESKIAQYKKTLTDAGITIITDPNDEVTKGIYVGTVRSVQGFSFDEVFIDVEPNDKTLFGGSSVPNFEYNKAMYVAASRARNLIVVTNFSKIENVEDEGIADLEAKAIEELQTKDGEFIANRDLEINGAKSILGDRYATNVKTAAPVKAETKNTSALDDEEEEDEEGDEDEETSDDDVEETKKETEAEEDPTIEEDELEDDEEGQDDPDADQVLPTSGLEDNIDEDITSDKTLESEKKTIMAQIKDKAVQVYNKVRDSVVKLLFPTSQTLKFKISDGSFAVKPTKEYEFSNTVAGDKVMIVPFRQDKKSKSNRNFGYAVITPAKGYDGVEIPNTYRTLAVLSDKEIDALKDNPKTKQIFNDIEQNELRDKGFVSLLYGDISSEDGFKATGGKDIGEPIAMGTVAAANTVKYFFGKNFKKFNHSEMNEIINKFVDSFYANQIEKDPSFRQKAREFYNDPANAQIIIPVRKDVISGKNTKARLDIPQELEGYIQPGKPYLVFRPFGQKSGMQFVSLSRRFLNKSEHSETLIPIQEFISLAKVVRQILNQKGLGDEKMGYSKGLSNLLSKLASDFLKDSEKDSYTVKATFKDGDKSVAKEVTFTNVEAQKVVDMYVDYLVPDLNTVVANTVKDIKALSYQKVNRNLTFEDKTTIYGRVISFTVDPKDPEKIKDYVIYDSKKKTEITKTGAISHTAKSYTGKVQKILNDIINSNGHIAEKLKAVKGRTSFITDRDRETGKKKEYTGYKFMNLLGSKKSPVVKSYDSKGEPKEYFEDIIDILETLFNFAGKGELPGAKIQTIDNEGNRQNIEVKFRVPVPLNARDENGKLTHDYQNANTNTSRDTGNVSNSKYFETNFEGMLPVQVYVEFGEPEKEQQKEGKLNEADKIVWAHPGIGKTYVKEKGRKDVIDFDSDYKSKINTEKGLAPGFKARNEWRKNNQEEWKTLVRKLWKEAKEEAKKTGKILMASDIILLREFSKDFDKVVTISEKTFVDRAKQRNDYTKGDTESWKYNLDTEINKIPKEKVIYTSKYMSDILPAEERQEHGQSVQVDNTDDEYSLNQLEKALADKMAALMDNGADIVTAREIAEKELSDQDRKALNILRSRVKKLPELTEDDIQELSFKEIRERLTPEQVKRVDKWAEANGFENIDNFFALAESNHPDEQIYFKDYLIQCLL